MNSNFEIFLFWRHFSLPNKNSQFVSIVCYSGCIVCLDRKLKAKVLTLRTNHSKYYTRIAHHCYECLLSFSNVSEAMDHMFSGYHFAHCFLIAISDIPSLARFPRNLVMLIVNLIWGLSDKTMKGMYCKLRDFGDINCSSSHAFRWRQLHYQGTNRNIKIYF